MLSGKESSAQPGTQSTSEIQTCDASIELAETCPCQGWWSTCCVMKWRQTFGTKVVLKPFCNAWVTMSWEDLVCQASWTTPSPVLEYCQKPLSWETMTIMPKPCCTSSTTINFCSKLAYCRIGPNRWNKQKNALVDHVADHLHSDLP